MAPLRLAALFLPLATAAALGPGPTRTGPWPVGFHLLPISDSAHPRPFTAAVWYPARGGTRGRLTYRKYLGVGGGDEEISGLAGLLASRGAPEEEIAAWLDRPMLAASDAPPLGGRHPLVLIAQGNGQTIQDQAPLAEFLASHGYVVGTAPSPMRLTGPLTDEREVGARAAEQARDLALLAGEMARRPDVDASRIGLVGHSFGARAALLLAMRDTRVAALVSLDGGIGTAAGRGSLEAAPGFAPERLETPVLHLYETADSVMAPDFGLLRSLDRADRWIGRVPGMRHHLFTSLGAAAGEQPGLRRALGASAEVGAGYAAIAAATADFLDAFVAGDERARERIRKGADWAGVDSVTVLPRRRPAAGR